MGDLTVKSVNNERFLTTLEIAIIPPSNLSRRSSLSHKNKEEIASSPFDSAQGSSHRHDWDKPGPHLLLARNMRN